MRSINSFATHLPKTDWLLDFFERQNDFIAENNLGIKQIQYFRRFLQEAGLINKDVVTSLAIRLAQLGWDTPTSLGIILANLAYNSQFEWYIKNMETGRFYTKKDLNDMFKIQDVPDRNAKDVLYSYGRFVQTPFGMTLNFGYVDSEDNYTRNKCHIGSPLVILYSLYKFAEVCGDYYEFTVSRLLNYNIDSDGISPTQIFGIGEDELKTILQGLTASNPDFITAKFTHDLDTISLNRNKTASNVLELL